MFISNSFSNVVSANAWDRLSFAETLAKETFIHTEAMAAWQWFNLHRSMADDGDVVINLDETSISLGMPPPPGFCSRRKWSQARDPDGRGPTTAEKRSAFTAVMMVSDATWLQPFLPQILIANKKLVRARDLSDMRALLPPSVQLWREDSGWINADNFERVIDILGTVVQTKCPRARAVLLMDTSPAHCHPRVLGACLRNRLRLVFIPALCTSLLQPLDTHILATFKFRLRSMVHDISVLSMSPDSETWMKRVLRCLASTITTVLYGRCWAKAFEGNGFGGKRFDVRTRLLEYMGFNDVPALPLALPAHSQFEVIFPEGRATFMDYDLLLGPLRSFHAEPVAAAEDQQNHGQVPSTPEAGGAPPPAPRISRRLTIV